MPPRRTILHHVHSHHRAADGPFSLQQPGDNWPRRRASKCREPVLQQGRLLWRRRNLFRGVRLWHGFSMWCLPQPGRSGRRGLCRVRSRVYKRSVFLLQQCAGLYKRREPIRVAIRRDIGRGQHHVSLEGQWPCFCWKRLAEITGQPQCQWHLICIFTPSTGPRPQTDALTLTADGSKGKQPWKGGADCGPRPFVLLATRDSPVARVSLDLLISLVLCGAFVEHGTFLS
jgi:hypothetical protein